MKSLLLCLALFSIFESAYSVQFSGVVLEKKAQSPIPFVNIGIANKNIGTVSGMDGTFRIDIPSEYLTDTLTFSCIGFVTKTIPINTWEEGKQQHIYLEERKYAINELEIGPRKYKSKAFGVFPGMSKVLAGFRENKLGYECGFLAKIRKSAILQEVKLHICRCNYDSVFYRLNIYEQKGKMEFENVLQEAIYLTVPADSLNKPVVIDLSSYQIFTRGNVLVTLEHIKDLGGGGLMFCSKFGRKTYYRKTSQDKWEHAPVGVAMELTAKVEK